MEGGAGLGLHVQAGHPAAAPLAAAAAAPAAAAIASPLPVSIELLSIDW